MSTFEKAKQRILSKPNDYTYSEARVLLRHLGFEEFNKGKTSGSRVKFYRKEDGAILMLHKPHPGDITKPGALKALLNFLIERGEL